MRNAARELDDLEPALHFAACVGQHLAVLAHDAPRKLVGVGVHQLAELEQDRRPLAERALAPRDRRFFRDGDGVIDVGDGRESNASSRRAGSRIVDGTPAVGVALECFAADPMVDRGGRAGVRRLSRWRRAK
jgi:hypothetical protein